jgi:hypothetical protein
MGNIDTAQQSLLNPSRLSLGKIWKGFDQLISFSSEVLLFVNTWRNFPEATKLNIGFLKRKSETNSLHLQDIMHHASVKD